MLTLKIFAVLASLAIHATPAPLRSPKPHMADRHQAINPAVAAAVPCDSDDPDDEDARDAAEYDDDCGEW